MSRVLSGVVLAAVFFAIVWFGSATVLLLVALAVCVLAFQEYATLVQRVGADIPRCPLAGDACRDGDCAVSICG